MPVPLAAPGAARLECTACGRPFESESLRGLSECCGKPLFARYDLHLLRRHFRPDDPSGRAPDIWRYAEVLPVRDPARRRSLGEGFTPLIEAPALAGKAGLGTVWIKDEGLNPTGSFKARGMAVAVARAAELGAKAVALPSAGNAGAAAAAYATLHGLRVLVAVPRDTPAAILSQTRAFGAELELVDGHIGDAGALIRRTAASGGWFDLSTLREPYRVEGKKTMAYELFEQLGRRLPDALVYPTGGGTGLVGMWKAFEEMEALGWIDSRRPRMIAVQAAGCAPIVRAWRGGADHAEPWTDPRTAAAGLRVPAAIGDYLMLRAIRESGGAAVAVRDDEIRAAVGETARGSGVYPSLEGAASAAAIPALLRDGHLSRGDEVVLFNTGSGLATPA